MHGSALLPGSGMLRLGFRAAGLDVKIDAPAGTVILGLQPPAGPVAYADELAVVQAVTFAMPHAKLGEDVAAAVVLSDGAQADEKILRAFVAEHLADFKVPRRIVVLEEIPKGATGKMQRIGLAEKLGLAG